jgi:hypothetical protein
VGNFAVSRRARVNDVQLSEGCGGVRSSRAVAWYFVVGTRKCEGRLGKTQLEVNAMLSEKRGDA